MVNKVIKEIISHIFILSFFVSGSSLYPIGFDLYWYYFPLGLFFIAGMLCYHRIDTKIGITLALVILYCLTTFTVGIHLVLKQLISISFFTITTYFFFALEKFNFSAILKKFVTVSKVILIIGFIQVFLAALEQKWLFISIFPFLQNTALSIRFQSIAQEPSFIAYTFAPLAFLSIFNLYHNSKIQFSTLWSVLFLIGYLLTLSVIGFVGLILMILFIYFQTLTVEKIYSSLIFFSGLCILMLAVFFSVEKIQSKINDTFYGLTHNFWEDNNYKRVNLSTYALLSNFYVTRESLKEHPLTGRGLGTHNISYDKYIPLQGAEYSNLNKHDANSLGLRLLSETGLIGFLFVIIFLIRFHKKSTSQLDELGLQFWIWNTGILIMFILILIRSGNYTAHGKIFFAMLYYFTYTTYSRKGKESSAN